MHVLFVTPDLSSNSLGRTYCLWRLAQHLGWTSDVVATEGETVWPPLEGSAFVAECHLLSGSDDEVDAELDRLARFCDVIVAVKPLRSSLGVADLVGRRVGIPVVVDIDDPDLSAALSLEHAGRRWAKAILKPRQSHRLRALLRLTRRHRVLVSNPVLQRIHGGTLIPHVRDDPGAGHPHVSNRLSVAFVGTNRRHKGARELRAAVAGLQDVLPVSLTVTDDPPGDARPWEDWIGMTGLARGVELVSASDVVVLPSRRTAFARGQLPAKLMDAMLAGRAVAVSDIEPMPWALGGTGLVIRPGSVASIRRALVQLSNPDLRRDLGDRARARALALFTVAAVAPAFAEALTAAVEDGRRS